MNPFLKQVAAHYINTPNLNRFTFVFPNRRSGKFFERELRLQARQLLMMPRIMTENEWIAEITGIIPVDTLEALMILYRAYATVMGDNAQGFDHFVFWANLIINDFDDADKALADTNLLYSNLSDLRQISTDYLSPELKATLAEILNLNLLLSDNSERFWAQHRRKTDTSQNPDTDQEVKQSYLDLWQQMPQIYHTYFQLLEQQHLSTYAHAFRLAAQALLEHKTIDLRAEQVVMVGFSQLSVSELAIFRALHRNGKAQFWWDTASPIFSLDDNNPAARQVAAYARLFPAPEPIEQQSFKDRQINVVAVPSNVGQAKWAFQYIDQLIKKQCIQAENAINTAIVLPDQTLFVPLINAISDKIGKINVTMGYPLRNAGIASLIRLIVKTHKQAAHNKTTNQWTYYHEDIRDILSHPLIKANFTTQALQIKTKIDKQRTWNVPQDTFRNTFLQHILQPIENPADKQQVLQFIDQLANFCQSIGQLTTVQDRKPDDITLPLQSAFIEQYLEAIGQLRAALDRHGLPATDDTIFFLIDRMLQHYVMPFEGEPLEGLQIMGLLETQSIDFQHLIILSANEHTFPARNNIRSLISDELRAAYNLPTAEQAEQTTAYYFYRMIARAQSVTLIYNSAAQSEPSRFIKQLQLLYSNQLNINHIQVNISETAQPDLHISVDKALTHMNNYTTPAADEDPENAHCLSASSINEFINCKLKFYFHHVEHLKDADTPNDFIDPASFGSIIHDTLQDLYYPNPGKPNIVTRENLIQFKQNRLQAAVERRINISYLHQPETTPITGETLILQETIEEFVRRAIDIDLQYMEDFNTDFIEVLECEAEHKIPLTLGGTTFNFSYKPDRVDRIAEQLRIIDYKTGKDETHFSDVDDLFKNKGERPKAILQLLLYCNAWVSEFSPTPIMPMIYQLSRPKQSSIYIKKEKLIFDLNEDINKQFVKQMEKTIQEIIGDTTPFTQTDNNSHCNYCHFIDFCQRQPTDY